MKEVKGDILSRSIINQADAVCFTSNGIIKNNGRLVMGAGVAKVFKDTFEKLDWTAAYHVRNSGNICQVIDGFASENGNVDIIAFPTKRHWKDDSDLGLILRSARQLVSIANMRNYQRVYLPRPGCRNGRLDWKDVRPKLEEILDDRFYIITLP